MRILFIGTVLFSKSILDEIIKSKNEIVGVIGKKKTNFHSDYYDLVTFAKKKKIKSIYTKDVNSYKIYSWVKKCNPDIILCIGWSQLLGKKLLNLSPNGVIGYHPSDLPKNRGRHPIIWSLVLGQKKIGSSFFFMNEKADSGKIISKKILKIKKNSNSNLVYKNLSILGRKQIKNILSQFKRKKIYSKNQNTNVGNFWRKRTEVDGKIDWRMDAENINNLVNALSKPYPGAYFLLKNKKIVVWRSKIINFNIQNLEPGKVIKYKKNFIIKCGNKALKLINISPKIKLNKIKYL